MDDKMRAEAYTDLVHALAMGPREHLYIPMEDPEGVWSIQHAHTCWACHVESLLQDLGEL